MRLPEGIVPDGSVETCDAARDDPGVKDHEYLSTVVESDRSVRAAEPEHETTPSLDEATSNGPPLYPDFPTKRIIRHQSSFSVDRIMGYRGRSGENLSREMMEPESRSVSPKTKPARASRERADRSKETDIPETIRSHRDHAPIVVHVPPCSPSPRMRQEVIPVYEKLAGPAEYHRFYWNCMELKSELIRLDFSLRSLGSSGPSIQATNSVKCALKKLRDLYGMNTAWLFPDDSNVELYNPGESCTYLADFSRAFNDLGDALDELARALYGFNTVYHDEKLMLQLYSLHSRFKAEVKTMMPWHTRDSLAFSADIQVLLDDWVDSALSSLKEVIRSFHDKGIPAINYAQNNTNSGYLTLTTIAFFLSGTTASMLQVSAGETTSVSGVAANTFLFSSLVFSIGSAVFSLVVMGWHKSVARVADNSLPIWLRTWLNAGPMVSLLVAGAFFAAALCLSVFSLGQHTVTSAMTIIFSGIHVSGLLFLSGYFVLQTWKFRQNAGAVGRALTKDSVTLSLVAWANDRLKRLQRMELPRNHSEAIPCGLEASFSVQAVDDEKGTESETTDSDSQAVWHALSDEKFLLNSTFVNSDTGGADVLRMEFTRNRNQIVSPKKSDHPTVSDGTRHKATSSRSDDRRHMHNNEPVLSHQIPEARRGRSPHSIILRASRHVQPKSPSRSRAQLRLDSPGPGPPRSRSPEREPVEESEPADAALHDRISSPNAGNSEASTRLSSHPPTLISMSNSLSDRGGLESSREPSVEVSSARRSTIKLDSTHTASHNSRTASLEPEVLSLPETLSLQAEHSSLSHRSQSRSRSPSPSPPRAIVIRRLVIGDIPDLGHHPTDESSGRRHRWPSVSRESRSRSRPPLQINRVRMGTRAARSHSPSYRGGRSVRRESPHSVAPRGGSSRGGNSQDSGVRARSTSRSRRFRRVSRSASESRGRRRSRSVSESRERIPRRRRSPSPPPPAARPTLRRLRLRAPDPPPPAPPGSVQAVAAFLPNTSRFRTRQTDNRPIYW